MIAFFFVAMFAGHIYILMIVTAIQIISFKEVIAISNVPSRARSLRFTKSLNWYFLGTTMYFLYGESVVYYFKHIILVDRVLLPFATHHRFISFMLYVFGMYPSDHAPWHCLTLPGFVYFVLSLQKGHYRFQFTQFAWTHMALCRYSCEALVVNGTHPNHDFFFPDLIVVQAHFILNNILEGEFFLVASFLWPLSSTSFSRIFFPANLVRTNGSCFQACSGFFYQQA